MNSDLPCREYPGLLPDEKKVQCQKDHHYVPDKNRCHAESTFVEAHMLVKICSTWVVAGRASNFSLSLQHIQ